MNLSPTINITVSGPGGFCNYDAKRICDALLLLGYSVSLDTNYTIEEQAASIGISVDEFMANEQRLTDKHQVKVKVKVFNQPWGG